jgi:hypothetical protein
MAYELATFVTDGTVDPVGGDVAGVTLLEHERLAILLCVFVSVYVI